MINGLRIKKFQSHEDSYFRFSPFVNIIQGLSTVGKSAVLRSKRLLIDNRPSGGKFFSNFAGPKGETEVEFELDNGSVKITKDIRINKVGKKEVKATHYFLKTKEGEFTFTGIGESVPDQVSNLLNMSELNFQRQFDVPFLISSSTSSGEIARTINRITKQEKVDEWTSALTSRINELNRDITSIEAEVISDEIELKRYADLEETGETISQLEKVQDSLNGLASGAYRLDKALVEYEDAFRKVERLRGFLKAERYILKAIKFQSDIDEYANLSSYLREYDRVQTINDRKAIQLRKLKKLLSDITAIVVDDSPVIILGKLCRDGKNLFARQDFLKKFLGPFADLSAKIEPVDRSKYEALTSLFDAGFRIKGEGDKWAEYLTRTKGNYMKELKKSKKCPVCLSSLSDKQLKEVEKSL